VVKVGWTDDASGKFQEYRHGTTIKEEDRRYEDDSPGSDVRRFLKNGSSLPSAFFRTLRLE